MRWIRSGGRYGNRAAGDGRLTIRGGSSGRARPLVALAGFLAMSLPISAPADPADPADPASPSRAPFGFRALEIFKASDASVCLNVCDWNDDGLPDLVYADNAEGTVQILRQRRPGEEIEEPEPLAGAGLTLTKKSALLNEIPSDTRFKAEKFYTDTHIVSLAVGDFDGDGRDDLAYFTDPPAVEVVLQSESLGAKKKKFRVTDGVESPYALLAADLDADGRDDLVLLGKNQTHLFYQSGDGELQQPVPLYGSTEQAWDIDAIDVDGDARLDLVYIVPSDPYSFVVRLQGARGFGPEIRSRVQNVRAWFLAPFQNRAETESKLTVFSVQQNGSRIKAHRWGTADAPAHLTGARTVALRGEGDPRQCNVAFADLDADGRTDLLVSYPETAEVEVAFQEEDGALSRAIAYPSLAGVNGLTTADVDGDGEVEVVVISEREKVVGVSEWRDGRLQLPRTIPLDGEPLLVSSGTAGDGEKRSPAVLVVARVEKKYELLVLRGQGEGERAEPGAEEGASEVPLRVSARFPLEGKGAAPAALRPLEINGDGMTDILVLVPYEEPYLYVQRGNVDPPFEEVSRRPGFGIGQFSKLEPLAIMPVASNDDGAGDRLLVAAKTYARLLALEDGRLRVVEQISGRNASAELASAVVLDVDGDGREEFLAYDRGAKAIEVYRRAEDGALRVDERVEIPGFEVSRLAVEDLDSDGRGDLVLVGGARIAILYTRDAEPGFEELWSYALDKKLDLGEPGDVLVGDLNEDRRPDLIVTTAPRYNLVFLAAAAGDEESDPDPVEVAAAFPIFEEKSYMNNRSGFGPRQSLVVDMDSDGLQDLLLLIHDRILLYLQDVAP